MSAAFGYTLAVTADGRVLSWGSVMQGGTGTALQGTAATVINGLSNIVAVEAANSTAIDENHSLAVAADGSVKGWGKNGDYGALGQPVNISAPPVATPIAITALGGAVKVLACGTSVSLALHSDGSVWMLPSTSAFNSTGGPITARQIADLPAVTALGRGGRFGGSPVSTCEVLAVGVDGSVRKVNMTAQPGSGGYTMLTQVSGAIGNLPSVRQATCSAVPSAAPEAVHCLAIATDGTVWAWGDNSGGQLGDGTNIGRTIAQQVPGLASITAIDVNNQGSFALAANGTLYSWGAELTLGRGENLTDAEKYAPGAVIGFNDAIAVTASYGHVCALRSGGSVWCWGSNMHGELGRGTVSPNYERLPAPAVGINLN